MLVEEPNDSYCFTLLETIKNYLLGLTLVFATKKNTSAFSLSLSLSLPRVFLGGAKDRASCIDGGIVISATCIPLMEGPEAVSLTMGNEEIQDPFFYLCGRFLFLKKPVVILVLATTVSQIWGMKGRILIREEEAEIFLLQFKSVEDN